MDDIYDDLDVKQAKEEATAKFYNARTEILTEYTLTEDDYKVSPNENVAKFKSFSEQDLAKENVPALLDAKMVYGQAGIDYTITYNYYKGGLSYLKDVVDFSNMPLYTLTNADYESMNNEAGKPGDHHNLAYNLLPADYLPPFLLVKYPEAKAGDKQAISYKYYANFKTSVVNSVWDFNGTNWTEAAAPVPSDVVLYELTEADYKAMGAPGSHGNFSSSIKPEDYLPTFLGLKDPYAMEGKKFCIVYKYYSNRATTKKAVEYTYTNEMWTKYSSTEDRTLSVAWSNDTKVWAYQPPFKLTVSTETTATDQCEYVLNHADYDLTGHGSHDNFAFYDNNNNPTDEYIASEITKMMKASSNLPIALAQGQIWKVTFQYYDKNSELRPNGTNIIYLEVGIAE